MPRTFLVDAHNALHRLYEAPPTTADGVRQSLVGRARDALAAHGVEAARAHLVFDTTASARGLAGTHGRDGPVSWSYADGSADEEILRLVREHGGRDGARRLCVVSDDRELRGRSRQLGAETLAVHAWFAAKDATPPREPGRAGPPLTAEDFGFTSDVIDLDHPDPDDFR